MRRCQVGGEVKKLPFVNITPDWMERWTAGEARKQLGSGFKFKGPGWYFEKKDTILVTYAGKGGKGGSNPKSNYYYFHVYGLHSLGRWRPCDSRSNLLLPGLWLRSKNSRHPLEQDPR